MFKEGGGDGGGGGKKVDSGGEGGGNKPSLFPLSFFRSFSLFCIRNSIPEGEGAFFISSLVMSFLSTSSSLSSKPTI